MNSNTTMNTFVQVVGFVISSLLKGTVEEWCDTNHMNVIIKKGFSLFKIFFQTPPILKLAVLLKNSYPM